MIRADEDLQPRTAQFGRYVVGLCMDIEILQAPSGEPILTLHGRAFQRSQQLGLETWSVSITDTKTHAMAMAVAIGDGQGSVRNESFISQ